jgi:hypothetical protein
MMQLHVHVLIRVPPPACFTLILELLVLQLQQPGPLLSALMRHLLVSFTCMKLASGVAQL